MNFLIYKNWTITNGNEQMMLSVQRQDLIWPHLQLDIFMAFRWHYSVLSFVSIYSFISNSRFLVIICAKACMSFWWTEHIKYLSCVFTFQALCIWKNWKLLLEKRSWVPLLQERRKTTQTHLIAWCVFVRWPEHTLREKWSTQCPSY